MSFTKCSSVCLTNTKFVSKDNFEQTKIKIIKFKAYSKKIQLSQREDLQMRFLFEDVQNMRSS